MCLALHFDYVPPPRSPNPACGIPAPALVRDHAPSRAKPSVPPGPEFPTALQPAAREADIFPNSAWRLRPATDAVAVSTAPVPATVDARRTGLSSLPRNCTKGAKALYRLLVELGDTPMEHSFFELVRATCKNKWPKEPWKDCADMAELVNEPEERTITWPEKWKANYIAEGFAQGFAQGRAEGRVGLLVSMARQRYGEAVAGTMSALLGSVRTESALDQIGGWLLTCETGDALIGKIRQM